MVETTLVVPDVKFGLEILDALDKYGLKPNVAVWLKENGEWRFLVSTPLWDQDPSGTDLALVYAKRNAGPPISDYPIDLEGNKDQIIRALRKAWAKKNLEPGTQIGGRYYGPFWYPDGVLLRVR
ncbi:MAG: hypothetical protein U0Q16_24160 [Bryobacteraceae bacterium]